MCLETTVRFVSKAKSQRLREKKNNKGETAEVNILFKKINSNMFIHFYVSIKFVAST